MAHDGEDPTELIGEARMLLRRAVGFDDAWLGAFDPVSVLPTAHLVALDPAWASNVPRSLAWAAEADDPMVTAVGPPSLPISAATDGCPERSRQWSECLQVDGIGDAARVLCSDSDGAWGGVFMFRSSEDAPFDDADTALFAEISPGLSEIFRRLAAQPVRDFTASTGPLRSAVMLFDTALRVISSTPNVAEWLPLFPDYAFTESWRQLPAVIYATFGRVRSSAPVGGPTSCHVRLRTGEWAIIDGSLLTGAGGVETALTIRPVSVHESFQLVTRTLGLSPRELSVASCLAQGLDTQQTARRLILSQHTVKVHVRSIFRRARVTSRGELVARLTGQTAAAS
jgi:DNA-binding CsgD family transcriptional regulator